MVMIAFRVVFIILMKDETNTPIYKEKFDSFADARDEYDRVSWDYPQAQVIFMRQEGDAVQVLNTRNPMGV